MKKLLMAVRDFAWYVGVGLSVVLFLLVLLSLLPSFFAPNFYDFLFTNLLVVFLLACCLNNFIASPMSRFRSWSLAAEYLFLIWISAWISVLDSDLMVAEFEAASNGGDAVAMGQVALHAQSKIFTLPGLGVVFQSFGFHLFIMFLSVFYFLRLTSLSDER
jgi:hypothetical protein